MRGTHAFRRIRLSPLVNRLSGKAALEATSAIQELNSRLFRNKSLNIYPIIAGHRITNELISSDKFAFSSNHRSSEWTPV